jgi:signal transduction histidine kinase/AraC-like DNA-binding protein
VQLLPLEKKTILLSTEIWNKFNDAKALNVDFYSLEKYQKKLWNEDKNDLGIFLILCFLAGGLLIMMLYNLLLFFQYKDKTYLYYAVYLMFSMFTFIIIVDEFKHTFFGNYKCYFNLILDSFYALSFVFYGLFVYSVINEKDRGFFKIPLYCYFVFLIAYIVFIHLSGLINGYRLMHLNIYMAILFRFVSITFTLLFILRLLKYHKHSYLKYILYGNVFLVVSFILHIISYVFLGGNPINHYYNLVGVIIEVLFFTYALNLKTKQVEIEKTALLEMDQLKSKFFANISHEFRTPLTLIKSPIQSIIAETSNPSHLQQLSMVEKNTDRMLELVDQMLQLSKIDSGKITLNLKEGIISTFLKSVIEPFVFQAKKNNQVFSSIIEEQSLKHLFDCDVLEKIISNLLSNALKYTLENQKISFSATIKEDKLHIKTTNFSSIDKTDLPKIFERYTQLNPNKQGVGIGLSLIKELVELYQGTIETKIENNIITFEVQLPLPEAQTYIESHNLISNDDSADFYSDKPVLLIVDDNEDIRLLLRNLFENEYKIVEAENGIQGFEMAKKTIPDVIITDLMMPEMDGLEFSKLVKNHELTSHIPIVVLTAKSSNEAHLQSLKSTANVFLTKPFNNEIVKETIFQLLEERKKLQRHFTKDLILKPKENQVNQLDEKFYTKLQTVIDKHIQEPDFSADEFASVMAMSRMQLHRKLKSLLGITTSEFIRNERLKMAIVLLIKGENNISEIAYSIGFNEVTYFSKCFKDVYNCAPSEYLNSIK